MKGLRRVLYLVAIAAALLFASCARKPEPTDARVLLPIADVEEVFGAPVKDLQRKVHSGVVSECEYTLEAQSPVQKVEFRTIQPQLSEPSFYEPAEKLLDFTRELSHPGGKRTVRGIGEDATWDGESLHFIKDDVYVVLRAGSLEQAKRLAAKVAGRL